MEEWVKYETEGYPNDSPVPDYRKVGVSYRGTFSGPFGSGIRNAQIPSYLIAKHAGDQWNYREIRESASAIDNLINSGDKKDQTLHINSSNLILLLQGNIYEGYACNGVTGTISKSTLVSLQTTVRARILELSLQIEKSIPEATEIRIGHSTPPNTDHGTINHIVNQIIGGNLTNISNHGDNSNLKIEISAGKENQLIDTLVKSGIAKSDAVELAQLMASETPASELEPFGQKAKAWIVKNISKAADGSWKAGLAVATQVLTEAALKFYGLK